MGAAVLQRDHVEDFLRGRVPAGREAVLAQRVGGDVGGKDSASAGTVAPVDLRVTLQFAVVLVFRLGVGFAEAGGCALNRAWLEANLVVARFQGLDHVHRVAAQHRD